MKNIIGFLKYTKWRPIKYYWPYPSGYGIYRKNRFSGQITAVDRYNTRQEAVDACKIENANSN